MVRKLLSNRGFRPSSLNLTADEFRVEGDVIALGPIHSVEDLPALLEELEGLGLVYFDDFLELS